MTIPTLPSAPLVTDIPADFNTKAFNWVAALDNWTTEANATGVAADADAATATSAAGTATTQAGTATTQAGIATSAASTATTQAGIATTKAGEANASAVAAAASAASINLNSIDINGGTIDGTVIGGSSAAAVYATTLNTSGTPTFDTNIGYIGKSGSGLGGNWRYKDDTGTSRWLAGLLGSAAATAFSIYDIVNAKYALQVEANPARVDITTTGLAVTGAVSATTSVTGGTGSAGLVMRGYTGSSSYGALYRVGDTPSDTNAQLISNAVTTILNGTTSSALAVGAANVAVATASGLAVTGALSATGVGSVGGAAAALNAFTINQASTYAETITNGSQAYAWRLDGTSLKLSDRTAFTEKLEVSSTGLAVTGALSATGLLSSNNAAGRVSRLGGLQISGTTSSSDGGNNIIASGTYWNGTNFTATQTTAAAVQLANGAIYLYTESGLTPSGTYSGAIRATLDASGNLGLGVIPSAWSTVSPVIQLGGGGGFVASQGSAEVFRIGSNAYYNGGWKYVISGNASRYDQASGTHAWYTAPSGTAGNAITFTQAMTLNASGNLLLGTTSTSVASGGIVGYGLANGQFAIGHAAGVASGDNYAGFQYNGTGIGSITQSGTTAVLYNTTSDARLKENITDANDAASLIDALQVRQFDWKSDGSHQRYGFVAQELYEVAPEAVCKPQDPDEMMAVDYSKLVPMLVKEIQSLRQRVAQLEGI